MGNFHFLLQTSLVFPHFLKGAVCRKALEVLRPGPGLEG